ATASTAVARFREANLGTAEVVICTIRDLSCDGEHHPWIAKIQVKMAAYLNRQCRASRTRARRVRIYHLLDAGSFGHEGWICAVFCSASSAGTFGEHRISVRCAPGPKGASQKGLENQASWLVSRRSTRGGLIQGTVRVETEVGETPRSVWVRFGFGVRSNIRTVGSSWKAIRLSTQAGVARSVVVAGIAAGGFVGSLQASAALRAGVSLGGRQRCTGRAAIGEVGVRSVITELGRRNDRITANRRRRATVVARAAAVRLAAQPAAARLAARAATALASCTSAALASCTSAALATRAGAARHAAAAGDSSAATDTQGSTISTISTISTAPARPA